MLAAIGASIGTVAGAALCRALSDKFPWGLVVNPYGLALAWGLALALAVGLRPLPRHPRSAAVADGGDALVLRRQHGLLQFGIDRQAALLRLFQHL